MEKRKSFADYKLDGHNWITLATGEYYPDFLNDACELYKPVLLIFGELLGASESSVQLFLKISEITDEWMRTQLARIFRRYVSPKLPVEMLKKKRKAEEICKQYGSGFRPIQEVRNAYVRRSIPDEALCAILREYQDRGKEGYGLTERFFSLFRSQFSDLIIEGPERAGKDILMGKVFKDYPKPKRPVDFIIREQNSDILAIGLARYDSDRGGSQEDDRTGGYQNCADEILGYAQNHDLKTKVIFLNDGLGLLLGSMWDDYSNLEKISPDKILVVTLRMVPERLTIEWLRS